jgi:hypothetical protein
MRYRAFAIPLVIALVALTAHAQSGRRQVKPPPAAPVPTPTPEPTPTPKETENIPELLFSVGMDRGDAFTNFPLSYYDAALRGCADRLRRGTSASVEISQQMVSRGDAIKKAKADTSGHVILLTLKYEAMARTADDLVLEFVVFAPGTAKIVTSGNSYVSGRRAGPIVVGPPGSSSGLYREQLVRQAAEEAAERILKKMNLGQAPKIPHH